MTESIPVAHNEAGFAGAPAGSFRELLRVALPLMVSAGSLSMMIFIDRMYCSWLSTDALAATLPAAALHWAIVCVAVGTGDYVNAFIAQYEGAGRKDRVAASIWQAIYLSLGAGVVILIFVPLAGPIFRLVGHDPGVRELEIVFFSTLCAGATATILAAVLACFFSGRGQTMVVLYVNVTVLLMNVVLDYLLIFGPGPFPALGVRGAALATVTSNATAVLIYICLMCRKSTNREYPLWEQRHFDRELFGRLIRYGLPTGLQFGVDVGAFTLFIFLIGTIGKAELAATNMAFNLNGLAFVPMLGCGIAVLTLVGRRIGEGRPELAVATTWKAFGLAGSYLLFFGLVMVLFPEWATAPFGQFGHESEFAPIREQVAVLLRFVAVFTFFDGMAIVFGSAVRGAGDTRFSFLYTLTTSWLLMLLPTFFVWWQYGGNLYASWWACTVYVIVLGIGFLLRFLAGRWKSMSVIEREASPVETAANVPREERVVVESV